MSEGWLERLSSLLLREPQDREQLVDLLRDAEHRHLLDADSLVMIEGVLQVTDMRVRDIMIPRSQMVTVDANTELNDFLPIIVESAHSRFPVIGESKDEVLGVLHAKELLKYVFPEPNKPLNVSDILRPAFLVPESKRLNILLKEFRMNHYHMAIVVDEYGGVAGLVTIEDVLEQIVGEIEDEYDVEEDIFIKKRNDNQYSVNALTPIEDFNEYFESQFSEAEYDTIGGLVMHNFGHLPKRGESITLNDYQFTIVHADNRRIRSMEIRKLEKSD